MIFIVPPHLGHSSGSTSYTRLINVARVETEPARAVACRLLSIQLRAVDGVCLRDGMSGSSALRNFARMPRCRCESQP